MANKNRSYKGKKLPTGYKVTLWIVGIILFLAFAFAIFTACGGLKLFDDYVFVSAQDDGSITVKDRDGKISVLSPFDTFGEGCYIDDNGNLFFYNGDRVQLFASLGNGTASDTDLSATDAQTVVVTDTDQSIEF